MQFQKLSAPSLKELFIEEMESKIISGELEIGAKLPSERELAASMQVSRAVVNMGIAELVKKGFLSVRPRIGTFVEDYRRNGSFDTLSAIIKYNGNSLTAAHTKSILELLALLVQLTAALDIQYASDEELQSLLPILEKGQNSQTKEEMMENTFHLYHEAAFISKNFLLPLVFASFKNLLIRFWEVFISVNGKEVLYQSNRIFTECLLSRDLEKTMNSIHNDTKDSLRELAKEPKEIIPFAPLGFR